VARISARMSAGMGLDSASVMMRWKIMGEFFQPKGILTYSYLPSVGIVNAKYLVQSDLTGT